MFLKPPLVIGVDLFPTSLNRGSATVRDARLAGEERARDMLDFCSLLSTLTVTNSLQRQLIQKVIYLLDISVLFGVIRRMENNLNHFVFFCGYYITINTTVHFHVLTIF